MKVVKVKKYGALVFSNEEMDALRRENCLCLNCGSLPDCPVAKQLLLLCKGEDLALAVTRCPKWTEKE